MKAKVTVMAAATLVRRGRGGRLVNGARSGSSFSLWVALPAVVALLMTAGTGLAIGTTNWKAPAAVPGDWWSAGNWDGGLPNASLIVNISNGGTAVLDDGNAVSYSIKLGNVAADSGYLIQNGGSLTTVGSSGAGLLYVGYYGTGDYQQSAGAANHGSVYVGYYPGSHGSYTVGAAAELNVDHLFVGDWGTGQLVQYGRVVGDGYIIVGSASGAYRGNGTYELHGGTVETSGYLSVGHGSTGVFRQVGGAVSSGGYVNVGAALSLSQIGDGTYELSDGGTLTADSYLGVGQGGVGVFQQKGGTVSAYSVYVGMALSPSQLGQGTYELTLGGSLTVGNGYMAIGLGGVGTMLHIDGTVSTPDLRVGTSATAHGTYEITAGVLSGGDFDIGKGGPGVLKVIGGAATISGTNYEQGPMGSLISQIDATGLSCIRITGGSYHKSALDGTWTVVDSGAPLGRFDVLTARDGITGSFDAVNLPSADWSWGITGNTLWVEHVPEPATSALLALGGLAALRRRRK